MMPLKKIKKPIICDIHSCSYTVPTCKHVHSHIKENQPHSKIYALYYENFLFEIYYKKLWLCSLCANNFGIPENGCLIFDPKLREIASLSEDELLATEMEDYETIDPFSLAWQEACATCRDCFNQKYGDDADFFDARISLMQNIVAQQKPR